MALDPKQSAATIPCDDPEAAATFLREKLGFRLHRVFPADAPREIDVTGHGLALRLIPATKPAARGGGWHEGRAGMFYRDLLPDRLGGELIASHIRIESGGEVPDYVHYHEVEFQAIYCRRGWVRVVYENQGEPFVMQAGDCVLQPPTIRHRVLESSPGLEVVEFGSPAEHETFAEHDLTLPNDRPSGRDVYGGQRFALHRAADATEVDGPVAGSKLQDFGMTEATGGRYRLARVKAHGSTGTAGIWAVDRRTVLVGLEGRWTFAEGPALSVGDARVLREPQELVDAEVDSQLLMLVLDVGE